MDINVLIEPLYRDSGWCRKTLEGINTEAYKKKHRIRYLPDFPDGSFYVSADPFENAAIILGTSPSWLPSAVQELCKRGIHSILVNAEPVSNAVMCSSIGMDYTGAMRTLIQYFDSIGKHRIALFGMNPNSYADRSKADCFVGIFADEDPYISIFENHADLRGCFEAFFPHVKEYDAVICANDLAALSLIRRLTVQGVAVPDDIMIASFGESVLSEKLHPTLTLATLDHREMGRQALGLYLTQARESRPVNMTLRMQCRIMPGESTACLPVPESQPEPDIGTPLDFYSDDEVRRLLSLEKLYLTMDETDMKIIRLLRNGKTLESAAEECFAGVSTIRYRLRRMLQISGAADSDELFRLFDPFWL